MENNSPNHNAMIFGACEVSENTKIFNSPDKCMAGPELKRLRKAAGLTRQNLVDKMYDSGWYQEKIKRYENTHHFCISPPEMEALLKALNAKSL